MRCKDTSSSSYSSLLLLPPFLLQLPGTLASALIHSGSRRSFCLGGFKISPVKSSNCNAYDSMSFFVPSSSSFTSTSSSFSTSNSIPKLLLLMLSSSSSSSFIAANAFVVVKNKRRRHAKRTSERRSRRRVVISLSLPLSLSDDSPSLCLSLTILPPSVSL